MGFEGSILLWHRGFFRISLGKMYLDFELRRKTTALYFLPSMSAIVGFLPILGVPKAYIVEPPLGVLVGITF